VTVTGSGPEGYMSVGFMKGDSDTNRLVGWDRGTWGYHADDGLLFEGSGKGRPFGEVWGGEYYSCVRWVGEWVEEKREGGEGGRRLGGRPGRVGLGSSRSMRERCPKASIKGNASSVAMGYFLGTVFNNTSIADYAVGDTVGAGIDFTTKRVFFTKNGKLLGESAVLAPFTPSLHASSRRCSPCRRLFLPLWHRLWRSHEPPCRPSS
jgi:hypothetical protein